MDPTRSDLDSSTPSPVNDLQGWKDIAGYLGKSVRAAQRWEQELGLPVHRLKTAAGQSIYARRDEIDRWRTSHEMAQRDPAPSTEPAPAPTAYHGIVAASSLVAFAVMVAATWWSFRSPGVAPVTFAFVGAQLEARDGAGGLLWTHAFDTELGAPGPERWRPRLTRRVFTVDFEGDGHTEVLAVLSSGPAQNRGSDFVYCLDARGAVLWRYEPATPLVFTSGTYAPPYVVRDVAIARQGGRDRVWFSVGHSVWWPGSVVELDRKGQARTVFVQGGQVNAISALEGTAGLRLLAAGVNNEFARPSLAVLDPDAAAHSPQNPGGEYECRDCGTALPLRYFLFPPSELVKASHMPYNQAWDVAVMGPSITVTTAETRDLSQGMLYEFDRDLRLRRSAPSDGFWAAHAEHPELGHAADQCPERGPRVVLLWEQGMWRTATAQSGGQPLPGSGAQAVRPGGS